MATQKQIDANRRNALRSSGPKTDEGKARSSQNALRHGVLSTKAVSHYEDVEAFEVLVGRLVRDLEPKSVLESTLVERIAILFWREQRLAQAEASQITTQNEIAEENSASDFLKFDRTLPFQQQYLIGRYQSLLGRQIRDALRDLREEKERRRKRVEAISPGPFDVGAS